MEVVSPRWSGLDVPKRFVVACLNSLEKGQRHKERRQFRTMTPEILLLKEWGKASACTPLAMESTGGSWKPLFPRLEGEFEIVLVNAQPRKAVPGPKTDLQDAEWLADLRHHGLLKASFIPSREQQAVRDLRRTRMRLIQDRTPLIQRIHKVLEEANIKLASGVTDLLGVPGQAILMALLAGELEPERWAPLARGSRLKKEDQLQTALPGKLTLPQQVLREDLLPLRAG